MWYCPQKTLHPNCILPWRGTFKTRTVHTLWKRINCLQQILLLMKENILLRCFYLWCISVRVKMVLRLTILFPTNFHLMLIFLQKSKQRKKKVKPNSRIYDICGVLDCKLQRRDPKVWALCDGWDEPGLPVCHRSRWHLAARLRAQVTTVSSCKHSFHSGFLQTGWMHQNRVPYVHVEFQTPRIYLDYSASA